MELYISAGESIKQDQRIIFEFYRCLEPEFTEDKLIFVDHMIQYEESQQPKYPQREVTKISCTYFGLEEGGPQVR